MFKRHGQEQSHALARAFGALLLIGSLLGCARATPTPEPVVIRFAHPEFAASYYQAMALEFQRSHPTVTIELLPMEWARLEELEAGDADVLVTAAVGRRQAEGQVLSLDPWLVDDDTFERSDFYPGTLELFQHGGKVWAIPAWLDPTVMYYNQDLFDQRGVAYPQPGWTWNAFMEAALGLSDAEAGTYGFVFNPDGTDCTLSIYQHGGRLFDDLQDPTRVTFDEPLTVDALQWCADLVHALHVAPTPEEARRAFGGDPRYSVWRGVYGGKVGLWTMPFSNRGGWLWPSLWPFKWGMVTLPRDAEAATWLQVAAVAITSQARHPDPCWQWISFLSRQMPSQFVPARRSLAESKAFEQAVGPEAAAVARASLESGRMIDQSAIAPSLLPALNAFLEAIEAIMAGEATPQEALSRAQEQAEQ